MILWFCVNAFVHPNFSNTVSSIEVVLLECHYFKSWHCPLWKASVRCPWTLLQAEQHKLSQAVSKEGLFSLLVISMASSGPAPRSPWVFLVLRIPDLDEALQVRSHQTGAEGQNPLPYLLPTVLWMQPRAWLDFQAAIAWLTLLIVTSVLKMIYLKAPSGFFHPISQPLP